MTMTRYRGQRTSASRHAPAQIAKELTPHALVARSSLRRSPMRSAPAVDAPDIRIVPRPAIQHEDVCAFLFAKCQEWQHAFLDDAGLACMFDVDAGTLPTATCEALATVTRARLRRLASIAEPPGGTITVMVRHRSPMWALAVTDAHVRAPGPRLAESELAALKTAAACLEGAYVIQPVDDGTLIGVLFADRPGVLSAELLDDSRAQFTQ